MLSLITETQLGAYMLSLGTRIGVDAGKVMIVGAQSGVDAGKNRTGEF